MPTIGMLADRIAKAVYQYAIVIQQTAKLDDDRFLFVIGQMKDAVPRNNAVELIRGVPGAYVLVDEAFIRVIFCRQLDHLGRHIQPGDLVIILL